MKNTIVVIIVLVMFAVAQPAVAVLCNTDGKPCDTWGPEEGIGICCFAGEEWQTTFCQGDANARTVVPTLGCGEGYTVLSGVCAVKTGLTCSGFLVTGCEPQPCGS